MTIEERSTLGLYAPLAQGEFFWEDITPHIWPSSSMGGIQNVSPYNRVSLAVGGDGVATFSFQAHDALLEEWFDNRLACHVVEWFNGVNVYQGIVHTLRLAYNGFTLSRSLDDVFNKIAVKYRTSSAGSDTVTSFADNTTSQGLYGTRQGVFEAKDKNGSPVYLSATSAATYRDNLLSKLAYPRLRKESIQASSPQPGTLDVEIRGYASTLDWILLKNTSTADDDADDEITDALSGANFVTAGTISTNTLQVKEEVDYVGAWQRIKTISGLGDSSGNVWLAGCYQARTLNYYQATVSSVEYFVSVQERSHLFSIYNSAGEYVPAPLVRPGGVAFVRDVMPGRKTESTLLNDPRSLFVGAVEYSQNGARLKDMDLQDVFYAALKQSAEQTLRPRPTIRPYEQSTNRPPLYRR